MKIGEKIRKYRKICQATQLDLGYHVKLSDLRVGQYETGKRNPKEDLIIKFAQALDIEPAALSNTEPDTIDGLMHIKNIILIQKLKKKNNTKKICMLYGKPSFQIILPKMILPGRQFVVKFESGNYRIIATEFINQWHFSFSKI